MNRGLPAIAAIVLSLTSATARADEANSTVWLPGGVRSVSRAYSASRDTPVFEYAYGPRAQLALGGELGVVAVHGPASTFRFGGSALIALENAQSNDVAPFESWRAIGELTASWDLQSVAQDLLGDRSTVEISVSLGREAAWATKEGIGDRTQPTDIPFGGGGWYLKPELGVRAPVAPQLQLEGRFEYRIFTNAFPDLLTLDEEADFVADGLEEGLAHAPAVDVTLRWSAWSRVEPFVAWHGAWLVPHDDSAESGYFTRLMLGMAFTGDAGLVSPLLSLDAGNGKGLLINRQELRFSVGVRYVAF